MEPGSPEDWQLRQLRDNHSPMRRARWVTLVYVLTGVVWIVLSDKLIGTLVANAELLVLLQTWKGVLFFLVTGLVLFYVIYRQLNHDRALLSLQHEQRRALRFRERQLTVLMNNLPGMAYRCHPDEHWTMSFVSAGCTDLTGYHPDELVNNRSVSFASLIDEASQPEVALAVEKAVDRDGAFSVEYALTRKDGERIWVWERGCSVEDDSGVRFVEGIILDISDRKALEQELEVLATRDSLTGLLNRRESARVLAEEQARASRYRRPLALLWADIDHFKRINDTWGHAAGDQVLCAVSDLLRDSVRSVDTVGRFGGEEFIVILPEMGAEEAREVAERLREQIGRQVVTLPGGEAVSLTISIGVAAFPDHGQTQDELCAAADKAMYRAKKQGRNCAVMAQAS